MNHAFAKELLAGIVGGEVDKIAETKGTFNSCCEHILILPYPLGWNTAMLMTATSPGMDAYDRNRAKERAQQGSAQMYDEHYGGQEQYDPNSYDAPQRVQNYGGRY